MCELDHLLDNNQRWSKASVEQDSEFFHRLAAQQKPEYYKDALSREVVLVVRFTESKIRSLESSKLLRMKSI